MYCKNISVSGTLLISLTCLPVQAQTDIPTSSKTVVLQTLAPAESSFLLPANGKINTNSGDSIDGDNSRNWQLLIYGVVNAASSGVSLSSAITGGLLINNYGKIISRSTSASEAGVVLQNGGVLSNYGIITGSGGTAVLFSGPNSTLALNTGSVLNGDVISNGANNTLIFNGTGSTTSHFAGSSGFSRFIVNADPFTSDQNHWKTSGDILLNGSSFTSGMINSGLLVTSGNINATNTAAGITVAKGAFLQVGQGGTTGQINVPVVVNGVLTFFRSDASLRINTEVAGNGVVILRGTGVNGQSTYVLDSHSEDFHGNIIIGNGARLQSIAANPTPQANIYVADGGTLWLGSSANYATPVYLQGNGWNETGGQQYGALRLDSNAEQSGPVTLLGNTRITAIFGEYFGTISGNISDGDNGYVLTKTGAGEISLLGNNTYSGGTLIADGGLVVSADTNLGTPTAPLSFLTGTLKMAEPFVSQRPLVFNAGFGTLTSMSANVFNGDISGIGHINIQQGNITFGGNDSHTGGTFINNGALLQIGSGLQNANTGTLNGNVVNNGTLIFNRAGTSEYKGTLNGTGALFKENSGTVVLSGTGSSQHNIQVNGGKLVFASPGVFNTTGSVATAANATTSVSSGAILQIATELQQEAQANLEVSVNLMQPAIVATQFLLDGTLSLSGAIASATEAASKTLTILHSTSTAGINGDFTSLGFSNSADYLVVYGGKANADTDYVLDFGLRWLAGPALGNGTFTLNNAADIFNVDVALNDQTGPFSRGWDGKTLTKAGAGTLILSQVNGYDGATQINGGTLQTNIADALLSSSSVSIAGGANLALNNFNQHINNLSGNGNVALGSASLTAISNDATQLSGNISGTGGLSKEGAQSLTLSGNSTYSGGTQINDGSVIATTGSALGSGTVTNSTLLDLNFNTNDVMNNLLTGSGSLVKSGTAIAALTASDSRVGSVATQQGTLLLATNGSFTTAGDFLTTAVATSAIGPRSSVNTGGLFDVEGTLSLLLGGIEPVVQATQVALGSLSTLNIAGITSPEGATEEQLAVNSYLALKAGSPGALTGVFSTLHIGGASLPVDYASVTGFTDLQQQNYNVGIRLNWYAAHSDTPDVATGTFTLANGSEEFDLATPLIDQPANILTGWDGKTLTKAGDGTLILSRHNVYTGATLITEGTLQTGITDAFTQSSNIAISNGAQLALGGFDQHINALSGSGDISLGSATLFLNNTEDNRFAGQISGDGGVTKSGNGSLTVTGDSTYTGTTTINAGTLLLGVADSPAGLASSQVNIASGATFGGYGSTAGNVNNQGTFAIADAVPAYSNDATGHFNIGGNLQNNGNIIMASTLPASTLTVKGNYTSNNGLLTLSTVLGGDNSATDKLVILGDSAGTTRVQINNAGGQGAQTNKGIELISVAGQSKGVFTQANRVTAGTYDYFLQKGPSDGNWYLLSQIQPNPPTPVERVIRPEAGSYTANMGAARTLFNQQLSDRAERAENSTLWLRQSGSHTNFYDNSGQLKTTSNRYVVQGGGELWSGQFDVQDSLGIGMMAGYGNAHSNTDSGRSGYQSKGTVDGYSSGLYATWYQNAKTQEGVYADSWLQYNWLNASVNGEQLSSEDYGINGFSGSVESGYRQPVYHGENGDVFITPQAQLIWSGMRADDHTESNGTRVSSTDGNNLLSRLGMKISRDGVSSQDRTSGKLFTTYVEANWLHNTASNGVSLDGDNVTEAGTSNIGEVKLGVEGKLNNHLNVWSNVGQQIGGEGYSDLSAVIGMNYQF